MITSRLVFHSRHYANDRIAPAAANRELITAAGSVGTPWGRVVLARIGGARRNVDKGGHLGIYASFGYNHAGKGVCDKYGRTLLRSEGV